MRADPWPWDYVCHPLDLLLPPVLEDAPARQGRVTHGVVAPEAALRISLTGVLAGHGRGEACNVAHVTGAVRLVCRLQLIAEAVLSVGARAKAQAVAYAHKVSRPQAGLA